MGLEYKCLSGMIKPTIHIDEFKSKMGEDDDVCVASFYITDESAAKDLVSWFEKGYDFILDADRSPGEIKPNKYLVYVEMRRRSNLADNLSQIIEDLQTLTDIEPAEWTFKHKKESMEFTAENFNRVIATSPKAYRLDQELALNEYRERAGLKTVPIYENDSAIKELKNKAGL